MGATRKLLIHGAGEETHHRLEPLVGSDNGQRADPGVTQYQYQHGRRGEQDRDRHRKFPLDRLAPKAACVHQGRWLPQWMRAAHEGVAARPSAVPSVLRTLCKVSGQGEGMIVGRARPDSNRPVAFVASR